MMCDCIFSYDKAAVGQRIRKRRMEMHLTREQMAEKLDKSLRMVGDLERGSVGMSIETLLRLCAVLKTTPNDLLLFDKTVHDSEWTWVLDALSHAPHTVRASAIDILRAYLRSV